MTDLRGWGLSEQHLLPDVVVAFVDDELSSTAHGRATAHLARCPLCAAEAAYQQQVRLAVRTAGMPNCASGFLDKLRAIPQEADLPEMPDGLAMTEDGQLVTVLRPDRAQAAGVFGSGPVLGASRPLGAGSSVLGRFVGARRARHSAGVVVSGLMLGALVLVAPSGEPSPQARPTPPRDVGSPTITVQPASAVGPLQHDENDRLDLLRSVSHGR
ncbi:zf-HC2 domain-containing protein [Umezawaea sp. Da 62-37]|uniref:zf-HC2 domain-containing protein n=1 Tax=Umezawaea sp. Da 62-37 TaxID=3075927 RepID=UPI0028F6CF12|nr:zf-HC2 domain-containing protein [Umezawaea sp. Da 62-37]WNV82431.1 zf-HC2 domain-containing protein [Umezawaea sp. Da 62-37]